MSCSLIAVKSLYQRTCHISSGWHGIHTRGRTCSSCLNAEGKTMPQQPPFLSCFALHLFSAQTRLLKASASLMNCILRVNPVLVYRHFSVICADWVCFHILLKWEHNAISASIICDILLEFPLREDQKMDRFVGEHVRVARTFWDFVTLVMWPLLSSVTQPTIAVEGKCWEELVEVEGCTFKNWVKVGLNNSPSLTPVPSRWWKHIFNGEGKQLDVLPSGHQYFKNTFMAALFECAITGYHGVSVHRGPRCRGLDLETGGTAYFPTTEWETFHYGYISFYFIHQHDASQICLCDSFVLSQSKLGLSLMF